MTTLAPPAELCGHRWPGPLCVRPLERPTLGAGVFHRCAEPAHPTTVPHRCRCGATTTERTPDDHRL